MGFSKEIYRQAMEEKRAMRSRAEVLAARKKATAYASSPRLEEIDRKLAAKGARLAMTALSGGDLSAEKVACDSLAREKEALLSAAGYTPADFIPAYACPICKDTGQAGGGLCECVHRLAKKLAYEQLSSALPLEESRFDNFDLRYYSKEGSPSPYTRMKNIYESSRQYAETFSPSAQSLLFFGKTGLGKTHLSLAIARTALEKGYGVIYGSAQDLLGRIEGEHFGRVEGSALENALSCDLLILDDLGTEFSTPFNLSVVNNLVSSRLLAGRPTIISTNLSLKELETRYTPRVTSRILGGYTMKEFLGPDIRQLKRIGWLERER